MERKNLALNLEEANNSVQLEQVVKIAEELFDSMACRLEKLFKEEDSVKNK